jgi:glucan phosphoethanolaminetransferase (alkaline phosphatase superfamily)
MGREFREIIVFLFFLALMSLALIVMSLGILEKNMLIVIISTFFTSGIFAFIYVAIYDIFADIYDEIDELKQEIERLKKKR